MNTKWNMAFFMFLGIAAAVLLLYTAIDKDNTKRPFAALVSGACAAAAFAVIAAGLNDPSKIITILSTPRKGFSGAVIMQVITCVSALFVFFKLREKGVIVSVLAAAVAVLSVCALSKIYMISTRPALNTYLVTAVMLLLTVQISATAAGDNGKRYTNMLLGINLAYGLSLALFAIRLRMLAPQDRILDFTNIFSGSLAPVFWGVVILTLVIPLICTLIKLKQRFLPASSSAAGAFLLCMLISQMPVIEKGVNNRIFF